MKQPVTDYPLRVLLVEDEISLRDPLAKHLRREHEYEVDPAADLQEAQSLLAQVEQPYDVALIDDLLVPAPKEEPEYVGIALLREIKERWPETEVIIFTGWGMERALEALRAGAYRYLAKPLNLDELGMTIRMAAERRRLKRQLETTKQEKEWLQTFLEIGMATTSVLELDEVLERVHKQVGRLMDASCMDVILYDESSQTLRFELGYDKGEKETKWERPFTKGKGLTDWVIKHRESLLIRDYPHEGPPVPAHQRGEVSRSWLGVPLVARDRVVGAITVQSYEPHQFDETHQRILTMIAGQVAGVVENARLYEEVKGHADTLAALYETGQDLISTLKLDALLQLIADRAARLTRTDKGLILLVDTEAEKLTKVVGFGFTPGQIEGFTYQEVQDGISGWVLRERKPTISEDILTDPRNTGLALEMARKERERGRSIAVAPLSIKDNVIGTMTVINNVGKPVFSQDDLGLVVMLADQAALAIENARLFEAETRRRHEMETLRGAALALTTTLDQQEVFERILGELQKVVPYDSASVQLLKGDHLEIIGGRGFPNLPDILGISFPTDGDNPNRVVMQRRAPFIVSDAPAEYEGFFQEPHIQADIHGWLGAPMLVGDRLIGMIALDKHQPGFYTEEHVRLAEAFAAQAAIAIENSCLFQAEREHREMAEALEEAAAIVSSTLDLDEVLDRILEQVERVVAGDAFNIMLIENSIARIVRWRGYEGLEQVAERTYPIAEVPGLLKMARTRETLIIQDTAIDLDWVGLEGREWICSYVGAPINVREQVVGFLNVNGTRPGQFAPADARRLEAFASHAAAAIENARLFREAQEGQAYLRSLYQASGSIISLRDPDQVLQDIVEEACDAVKGWRANVVLIDEEGRPQRLARVGFDKHFDIDTSIRPTGISAEVVQNGELVLIKDVQAQSERVNPGMIADGIGAAACFPLHLRGKCIGVMWMHYREPRRFSGAEVEALRLYANQAAIAYDNARRMRELEHLRKAAEKLASVAGVREVLQQIVKSARKVLEAHSSAVWSYDQVRDKFIPEELVAEGIPEDELERFQEEEPRPGRTAYTVMQQGWVSVEDISQPGYEFLGEPTRKLLRRIGVRSFQGIVLKVGEERLGVLYVNYRQPHSFGDEDKTTLETFAYDAALALKKARLLQQVEQTKQAAQVVAGVTVHEDLQKTLDTIVQHVREVLQCDAVSLYSYDETKDRLGPWAIDIIDACAPDSASPPEKLSPESAVWTILTLEGPTYHCLAEDGAVDHPLFRGKFVRKERVRAAFGIQFRVGERKAGVMFVNYRSSHRFSSDEIATIELFANQAAVAIRSFQLYEEVIRRANALEALYEAGKAVTSTLALEEILSRIAEQAWRFTGHYGKQARFSHLALVQGNRLKFKSAYPPEHLPGLERGVGDIDLEHDERIGVTGRAVKTGQSQLVGDVAQDPDYVQYDLGTRSELAVPIKLEKEIIGVINVEHPEIDAFDEQDRQTLEALAAQASLAIRNAQVYAELKRRYDDLYQIKGFVGSQTVLDWMRMVSTVWGHNIKREVGTSLVCAELVRCAIQAGEYERALGELEDLERKVQGIKEIPITAPLSAEDAVTSTRINRLVETYLRNLWRHSRYSPIKLELELEPELDDTVTVRASEEWLRRGLEIVVDNAVQAMLDTNSTQKQLLVETHLTDGIVEILIHDTGPGIPREIREKLFKEPIDKPKGSRGAGIGLVLAGTIFEAYQGNVAVKETGPTGTLVMISLPVESNGKTRA